MGSGPEMKICVFGLWHLGSVTAACLAKSGFKVIGLDFDEKTILTLISGKSQVYEPGLDDLISSCIQNGNLSFTVDVAFAVGDADVVWVTFDTPVDDEDRADVEFIEKRLLSIMGLLKDGVRVIISSQVPVGFTGRMEKIYATNYPGRKAAFAYSPENLRLGKAIQVFENPDRIVIGVRDAQCITEFQPIFSVLAKRLEWMRTESAEMTKHAINAFLATSVVFANEIATLCESVGADAKEVERGLKSEERIGPKAYLSPGAAFAGGTLARDVQFLINMGQHCGSQTLLFKAVKDSNDYHRDWVKRKCKEYLENLGGRKIAVLGLTYKPGTSTLRRSWAIELCRWLYDNGVSVQAYDPQIRHLTDGLDRIISLGKSIEEAVAGVDCIIIATEYPVFRDMDRSVIKLFEDKIVIDANGFIQKLLDQNPTIRYSAVGRGLNETKKA
ncbi:MAG: nucleotide sugar dehydrogenase [Nitrospirae bacterium]|nr:nucleotide sugar dehydrogenase [Nitrospirota bacterium]MCL5237573.1 nucleotide sugar dehydrogenase [Nitrospirota bacterium]